VLIAFRRCLQFVEAFSGNCVMCALTRKRLPPPHDGIDLQWIQLHSVAPAAGTFRRNHGRAAAKETVEHNVTPGGAFHDRVGHEAGFTVGCNASKLPSSPERLKEFAPG
jgi:hypothetical protein